MNNSILHCNYKCHISLNIQNLMDKKSSTNMFIKINLQTSVDRTISIVFWTLYEAWKHICVQGYAIFFNICHHISFYKAMNSLQYKILVNRTDSMEYNSCFGRILFYNTWTFKSSRVNFQVVLTPVRNINFAVQKRFIINVFLQLNIYEVLKCH